MRLSIYGKLIVSFVLVASTTAALVALFVRLTSTDRLTQLIVDQRRSSMQQLVAGYYDAHGSWDGVSGDWQQFQLQSLTTFLAAAQPYPEGGFDPSGRQPPSFFALADAQGVVIVPASPQYPAGEQLAADQLAAGTPILVERQRVGTLLTAAGQPQLSSAESLFLRRTNQALGLANLVALFVALTLGIFLARTITRPLQALTTAAQNIAQGRLAQQVRVDSDDEIGHLADAFNRMSAEVTHVNSLRQRMTADIAHDLRTPLTVIGGYVESMRDGILQPTPARLSLIYAEIERLQNLVGDLRMLSQAEAGELRLNTQWIKPRALLGRAAALFRHQAEQQDVAIWVEAGDALPEILVDEARMIQVLGNLLSNALRYTPAGGQITLRAESLNGKIEITVQDTGTGIPAEELPNIFDRFYRVDRSRNVQGGETGLGLAIVKALVESHGGHVSAESILGNGTAIRITL